jgi:hypothetical protein
MQLNTKAQIAKSTLSVLTVVVVVLFLGAAVIVLCAGLRINPFREATSNFLIAGFAGLIGVAAALVLLNVATNISLIADAKISELRIDVRPGVPRRWLQVFLAAVALLAMIVVGGTYASKERYLSVVKAQADQILKENNDLLEEISRLLASGKPEDFRRIYQIRTFLQNQRADFPRLTLIYSGRFADKMAFYGIGPYSPWDLETNKTYEPVYFQCTQHLDCDYLRTFFSNGEVQEFKKYTIRDDEFYIYIPHAGKESRFVLLFDRANGYGKMGS